MLVLRDTIGIRATPEQVFDWLAHLEENYTSWHPDHVSCRHVSGPRFGPAAVYRVEQYLHGKLHRLTMRVTRVIPNRELRYRIAPGFHGTFRVIPQGSGVQFVAELTMGWSVPVLGPILDALLGRLLSRRLAAQEQHMREEGENLRTLLEEVGAGES